MATTSNGHSAGLSEDSIIGFERSRIGVLKEERQFIQKKTFTKWMNSYLNKMDMNVNDLFTDLADGKLLLKLLEIISGEKIGKPSTGKMRVHKVENLNKSLSFLHTKVRLESIGAEDIVDGNPTLILGLIWTIILRFQIQDIFIAVDEEDQSGERKSAKEALLLWAQRKTHGYQGVKIENFSSSWKNGLSFNALIHAHRPDLIDYDRLRADRPLENLNYAFDVAEKHLNIARLLDPEDLLERPDEKSVMTYVASYWHTFAKSKDTAVGGKRIGKIVGSLIEIEQLRIAYEKLCTDLLTWLVQKTVELKDRSFGNNFERLQRESLKFKEYRLNEKPPRMMERGNIEVAFFDVQTKRKALSQAPYLPPEGYSIQVVDQRWKELEMAEHQREVALRKAMIRLERLERLAEKFERKAALRNAWLTEMTTLLSDQKVGKTIAQIDASLKKFEAINADIQPRDQRFAQLASMATELLNENYHGKDKVVHRNDEIARKWRELLELLAKRRGILGSLSDLIQTVRDADSLCADLKNMELSLRSTETGQHLTSVQVLIHKHSLTEAELIKIGKMIQNLNAKAPQMSHGTDDQALLQHSLKKAQDQFKIVVQLAQTRRGRLDEALSYHQFEGDAEEEDLWALEKLRTLEAMPIPKASRQATAAQQKAKLVDAELNSRWGKVQMLKASGEGLVARNHPNKGTIQRRLQHLLEHWSNLKTLQRDFLQCMEAASEFFQYHGDADELESWLKETQTIINNMYSGGDMLDVESLTKRHARLEEEMSSFDPDIRRLNDQAIRLQQLGPMFINLRDTPRLTTPEKELSDQLSNETVLSQVIAMFPFKVQDLEVKKGEVMTLIEKVNDDWWHVRKSDGLIGPAPANHLKEIVSKSKEHGAELVRQMSKTGQKEIPQALDPKFVSQRQKGISDAFFNLKNKAAERRKWLGETIGFRDFFRECADVQQWIMDRMQSVFADNANEPLSNQQRRYDVFLPEFSAHKKQLSELQKVGNELASKKHQQSSVVKTRLDELMKRWVQLEAAKVKTEKQLEYRTGMEAYDDAVKNAADYIYEKTVALKIDAPKDRDITSMKNLHKKIANSQRELIPIKQIIESVRERGVPLKKMYPNEEAYISSKERDLESEATKLEEYLKAEQDELEGDVSHTMFQSALGELQDWAAQTRTTLDEDPNIEDHQTASEQRQQLSNLIHDIKAHESEFAYVMELGKKTVTSNPASNKEVVKNLSSLQAVSKSLLEVSADKEAALIYVAHLLELSKKVSKVLEDVSRIEGTLAQSSEVGNSIAEVETLLRRHEDLDHDMKAVEDRSKVLLETSNKLVNKPPSNRHLIRRPHEKLSIALIKLRDRIQKLPELHHEFQQRRLLLADSLQFQSWRGDVDDLNQWMDNLLPIIEPDPSNEHVSSEKAYRRHTKQVAEINANSERIQLLFNDGKEMIVCKHFASTKIAVLMEDMLKRWEKLTDKADIRNIKFEQAAKARGFYGNVDKAKTRLTQIQLLLERRDGIDENADPRKLRSELKNAESSIKQAESMVGLVKNDAILLAQNNHANGPKLVQAAEALEMQLNQLQDPAKRRWAELEDMVRRNQIVSDMEKEAIWIDERLRQLRNPNDGKTLDETASLLAKLEGIAAEIAAHEPIERAAVTEGTALAKKFPDRNRYESLVNDIIDKWQKLTELLPNRKIELETIGKGHQYQVDYAEVDDWLEHNLHQLRLGPKSGKDPEKLLSQNDQLKREFQGEKNRVVDLDRQAKELIQYGHPDAKSIANFQRALKQKACDFEETINARDKDLLNSHSLSLFFDDCNELENWLRDQIRISNNSDCGCDTETLNVARNDFNNFKHRVEEFGARRLKLLEEEAEPFRRQGPPSSVEVEKCVTTLLGLWVELKDSNDRKSILLNKMSDVFGFSELVAVCIEKIKDAMALCHADEGRDLKDVQRKLQLHDVVEKEMESILLLIDPIKEESMRLIEEYPGKDAEHVAEQRQHLTSNWDALRKAAIRRRAELESLKLGYEWLNSARDLDKWAEDTLASLALANLPKDKVSTEVLIQHHDDMKTDIASHDPNFEKLLSESEKIRAIGTPVGIKIAAQEKRLQDVRKQLHVEWDERRNALNEIYTIQKFLRELDQLDARTAAQETYLQTKEPSDLTADQVRKLISRHAAFEKVVTQQMEKLTVLESQAEILVKDHHIDPKRILPRMKEVAEKRNRISGLTNGRTVHLREYLTYAEFIDIASDVHSWVEEKINHMKTNPIDELEFEEKIRNLIKHQAFEAELNSNAARVEFVKNSANKLIKNRHEKSTEISDTIKHLSENWSNLLKFAASRGKALDDAKDMVAFQNECDRMEKWMRDKEQMLSAEDLGKDLEHCMFIQRKLDDVGSDMKFDETQISSINVLADKLSKSGLGKVDLVVERRKNLSTNWEKLRRRLDEYRVKLRVAKELHGLENSIADTEDLLVEKATSMKLEDARDVEEVTGIIRKHESLARDLDSIEIRIKSLDKDVLNSYRIYPVVVQKFNLEPKMASLRSAWHLVSGKMSAEKEHLDRLNALLKFLKEVQDFCTWSEYTQSVINNGQLADDTTETERLMEIHSDIKAKIQNREKTLGHLIQQARGLPVEPTKEGRLSPGSDTEDQLKESWNKLNAAWNHRQSMLQQCQQYLVFNLRADEVDSWLASKEAFLANEDLGMSMSEVESLLRKQNAFDNTVSLQADKVTDIATFAKKLIADEHYAKDEVDQRYNGITARMEAIRLRLNSRKSQLEQSERYQQFLKSLTEFNAWMEGKFQLVNDNSWKDPVHLAHKLQKQASFETELRANEGRFDSLVTEGEAMLNDNHFASGDIRSQTEALKQSWNELQSESNTRRRLLLEVQHALKLTRRIEEFESWLDIVESFLNSDDIGSNLSTCVKLAERCEALKIQIATEGNTIKDINGDASTLATEEHFLSSEIKDRLATVNNRYEKLSALLESRMVELDSAKKLHQFNLEHHEIILWFKEKQAQLDSRDVGTSLSEAQSLLRKILQLDDEISDCSSNVHHAVEAGCKLLTAEEMFASEQITPKLDELRDTYHAVKKQCAERKRILEDSVDAQKFYAEARELEGFFTQKKILLESNDSGDDEDSTKLLTKKLDSIDRDVHSYGKNVERMGDTAQSIRERQHFDALNVHRRFEALKDQHRELVSLVKHRRQQLLDSQRSFAFIEDCAALMTTLREKMDIADSEDYGNDVEHVEFLLQKFAQFSKSLSVIQVRVKNLNDKAVSLCNQGHPQVQLIRSKAEEVNFVANRLQESTNSRQQALLGAREVHVFIRDTDETIGWIQERDAIVSSEDFGQDLESVQSLIRRHDGFQRDMTPLGDRVIQLIQEAGGLVLKYPDAKDHIDHKQQEMHQAWLQLVEKSTIRKDRLHLAESLQNYLNKYREFSLWISEMLAIMTSYDIPQEVKRAEAIIIRHKEHTAEIDSRHEEYNQIRKEGIQIIQLKHFMSEEVRDKLSRLEKGYEALQDVWKKRNELYSLNLDVQIFLRDCNMLSDWMRTQEPILRDESLGDSVQAVEELLRKYEDFQKTVENQEERFNLIRRLTELEKAYAVQKSRENDARESDRIRREMDNQDQIGSSSIGTRLEDSELANSEALRKISVTRAKSFTPFVGKKLGVGLRQSESFMSRDEKLGILGKQKLFSTKQRDASDGSSNKDSPVDHSFAVEMEGSLERKQELDHNGEKATSRSWKTYHTVLCGQLLCFFKKRQPSYERGAVSPPFNLHECLVTQAHDYRKKDNVFRLHLRDGSEYLFAAENETTMNDWMDKLQFHAALPPNLQLMSYKEGLEQAAVVVDSDGNDAERTLKYARTLSRNTPSPSGYTREVVPIPKPRQQRTKSPENPGANGSSRTSAYVMPEEEASVEIRRGSAPLVVARSESFHGDYENGDNERAVDVDVRAQTTSSLVLGREFGNGKKGMRGTTLPVGSTLGQKSPELSTSDNGKSSSDKRGSKTSLLGGFFKKKDRSDKHT